MVHIRHFLVKLGGKNKWRQKEKLSPWATCICNQKNIDPIEECCMSGVVKNFSDKEWWNRPFYGNCSTDIWVAN